MNANSSEKSSEIATELLLLHEVIDTLGRFVNDIGFRIVPVSLPPPPKQTGTEAPMDAPGSFVAQSVFTARQSLLKLCGEMHEHINGLRC